MRDARMRDGLLAVVVAVLFAAPVMWAAEPRPAPADLVYRVRQKAPAVLAALGFEDFAATGSLEGTPAHFTHPPLPAVGSTRFPVWQTRRVDGRYVWERIADRTIRNRAAGIQIYLIQHHRGPLARDSWEEMARQPSASGSSRTREVTLGTAPQLARTGWIQVPYDTEYSRTTFSGPSEGERLVRTVRRPVEAFGYYRGSDGYVGLYKRSGSDVQKSIQVRALYRGIDPPFEIKVVASNFDYALTVSQVDSIVDALLGVLLDALGPERPREPAPEPVVAGPSPEPETAPAPEAEPGTEPEPLPVTDRTPEPGEERPSVAERIDAMDALFRGVEDALQGALMQMAMATRGILEAESRIQGFIRMLREDDLMPSTARSVRESIQELRREQETLERTRDELDEEAIRTMDKLVRALTEMDEEGQWGEADFNASVRVITAEERRELLVGQLLLARNELDALEIYAAKLKSGPPGSRSRKNGLGLEGIAQLRRGRLVEGLEAFRTLRRRGYVTEGTPYEAMERVAEVELLRAMQEQTVATRIGFHQRFEAIVATQADTRPGPFRDREANWSELDWWKDRADWWLDGTFWMSWYRSTQGAVGEVFGVETEAGAQAREVGTVADEMAIKHVGLGIVIGLRQKGHSLQAIREMSTEELQAAFFTGWGKTLTPVEANQRRATIHRAFELQDLVKLASGDRLEDEFDFSRDLAEAIRLDPTWARKGAEWGAFFGDMTTPGTIFMTFAPMAKFALSVRPMASAAAAQRFRTVHTLAEKFQSSAAFSSLVRRTAGTAAGRKFLQAMTKVARFADRGRLQAATVFLGELIVQQGASHTIGQTLGDEAQLLFDALISVGAADTRTLANTFSRVTSGSQLRRAAGQMRLLADRSRKAAMEAQDLASRIQRASSNRELAQLRRQIEKMADLPPEISSKMHRAITQIEAGGSTEAVRQMLDDVHGAANLAAKRAGVAKQVAEDLEDLSYSIPDEPGAAPRPEEPANPTRADGPGNTNSSGEPAGTRQPLDGEPRRARPPGDEPAATLAPVVDDLGRPPSRVADPPPPMDARFLPNQRNSLGRAADRAMLREEFEKAADAYEALLAETGDTLGDATRAAIEAKYSIARAAAVIRAQRGRPAAAAAREFTADLERDVKQAITEGRYEPPPAEKTSLSSPRAIFDENGNPIAYFKSADLEVNSGGFLDDAPIQHQGEAEVLASKLRQAAGRPGPSSRVLDLEIDGKTAKTLVVAAFEPGTDLASLLKRARGNPRLGGDDWVTAALLAHKGEIAEDIVYSMVLGDGDRHFGNFWLGRDGSLMPFDYGLADIRRQHSMYRNERLRSAILDPPRQDLEKLLREADELFGMGEDALRGLESPNFEQRAVLKQIDQARAKLEQLTKIADGVPALYRVPGYPEPPDFRTDPEGFADFVGKLMPKHFEHGTREWRKEAAGFLESAIRQEDVLPHIERLEALRQSGEIRRIVQESLEGATEDEIEFAVHMLEARVDNLREFFARVFPSVPDLALLESRPTGRITAPALPGPIFRTERMAA